MTPPIPHLRWRIAAALLLSSVIGSLDRLILTSLAPQIRAEFGWDIQTFTKLGMTAGFALIFGQTFWGWLLDRVGLRRGMPMAAAVQATGTIFTAFAAGLGSFAAFRTVALAGDSANWPGAAKGLAQWLPQRETGWAVAIFKLSSFFASILAPLLLFATFQLFQNWRACFVLTGLLGLLWILLFRRLYELPEAHPRLSEEEQTKIFTGRADPAPESAIRLTYRELLRMPQTWGIVLAKSLTDPVWFLILNWAVYYLVSQKGYPAALIAPVMGGVLFAADLGSLAAAGVSSSLIARGRDPLRSRWLVAVVCAVGMTALAIAAFANSLWAIAVCFGIAAFSHAGFSTILLTLPGDLYPTGSVASVSGLSGACAGVSVLLGTLLTGWVAEGRWFGWVLVGGSVLPWLAMVALVFLVGQQGSVVQPRYEQAAG